ncbi:hypothetical protein B7P43_G18160 [Cryptotermes secundus]|uniref:Uncharacterized protein n=1 Tax=Cryptotermes secundus TaxID=105785 RepID=A0A2J7PRG5_9NEOP|nr:hypothetical protein B7P43_G18160 [Cryptotermes secundus]
MGTSQALVNAILSIVSQQFKKVIPRRFIVGKWADMGSIMVEEFPNWADVWRNISSAAKHCKSLIDDEVVNALSRFFDYNVKQIFKFLNPSPTEESATVLGGLYTVSHGRLPTAECYTLTSALGAKHIVKCWRMASLRKKHLKRDTDYNCNIMSKIYSSLIAQAEIFDPASITRHFVFFGVHNAIFSFLESLGENSSEDMPPVHSHFLTMDGERKKYYSGLGSILGRIGGRKRSDVKAFTYDMENTVKDIMSMGELQLIGNKEEVYAPEVDPVTEAKDV